MGKNDRTSKAQTVCWCTVSLQREELRVAFHAFDKNKTGKLDVGEMKYLLKSIGVCLTRREQKALEAGGYIELSFLS